MRKNKRILFVCTGNTCRSPMAEIILKAKLKAKNVTDVRVWSAGISTENGLKISKNSFEALKKAGYKPYGFKSRQLTQDIINRSDIIICMTKAHKQYIKAERVYSMDEVTGLGDIPDPYGKDINVYMNTLNKLNESMENIAEQILYEKGDKK